MRFGADRLAGIAHAPAEGPARRVGVLCPSIFYEYQLCHRTLRALADRLASEGALVLRLDYTGIGDASGGIDAGGIERWTDDVLAALAWIRGEANADSAFLFGVRLGGTLAWRAAASLRERGEAPPAYAWAPVVDGAAFVEGLDRAHADWYARYRAHHRGDADPGSERGRVLGHPFPEALRSDLASARPPAAAAPLVLIETEGGGEAEGVERSGGETGMARAAADTAHAAAEGTLSVPAPAPWLEDPDAVSPPVPAKAIERIAAAIREGAP